MDLRNFPFDRQLIRIRFGSKFYGDEACHFVDYTDPDMIKVFSNKIRLTEWKLTSLAEVRSVIEYNDEDKRDVSIVEIDLHFKRLSGYYLKNIVGLLFILSIMSWAMCVKFLVVAFLFSHFAECLCQVYRTALRNQRSIANLHHAVPRSSRLQLCHCRAATQNLVWHLFDDVFPPLLFSSRCWSVGERNFFPRQSLPP